MDLAQLVPSTLNRGERELGGVSSARHFATMSAVSPTEIGIRQSQPRKYCWGFFWLSPASIQMEKQNCKRGGKCIPLETSWTVIAIYAVLDSIYGSGSCRDRC